jgi:8-amino-7-oxononanoate synthase
VLRRLSSAGLVEAPIEGMRGPRVRVGGEWLLNFATTDYLGLAADPRISRVLGALMPRTRVSLGAPRLLAHDNLTPWLERTLAARVGQERALVFPSTTHAARDVLALLVGSHGSCFVDEWAYPISVDAAQLAAADGLGRARRFPHDDAAALGAALAKHGAGDAVVVCDGVYPATAAAAALGPLLRTARRFDAVMYVDDAHGFGVLGGGASAAQPYGRGGGGTPAYASLPPGRFVHVGSLSKSFGAPVSFVAGPAAFIDRLRATAGTFVHSSPPAAPTLLAALVSLTCSAATGDRRRRDLAQAVQRFRAGLERLGLPLATHGLFPIQSLHYPTPAAAWRTAVALRRAGVWPILHLTPPEHPGGGAVRFVLSAAHNPPSIETALERIGRIAHEAACTSRSKSAQTLA